MISFIAVLRALVACLITNAHYTGIYPIELIANGGLIGDVLFFAVSGYYLYNVKTTFPQWYIRRLTRIYPAVIIITAIYRLIGAYSLSDHSIIWWFVYPTYYHFAASIIMLYIPFYFCMKVKWLKNNLINIMFGIAVVYMIIYLTVYDYSYYHIDIVREPMIRFLFMESMLLRAWFRQNDLKIRNVFRIRYISGMVISFIVYFATKLIFSCIPGMAPFQILNQITIYILLLFIFRFFAGIDEKLERMPVCIKKIINFLSLVTLEIYLVQYVLIDMIRPFGFFPVNWLLLTAAILLVGYSLHYICKFICLKKRL